MSQGRRPEHINQHRPLTLAGNWLGLGLGGFFDGNVFHQFLQWHHMLTNAGYLAVYGVCRLAGTIVRSRGSFFHHVAASSAQNHPTDVLYFPLRATERSIFYTIQPIPVE